jgi:hypothetical protein
MVVIEFTIQRKQMIVIVFLSIREWRMADECHSIPKNKSIFSIS